MSLYDIFYVKCDPVHSSTTCPGKLWLVGFQKVMKTEGQDMSETQDSAPEQPEDMQKIVSSTTPEFDTALIDAGRLLEHAASSGQLPEGGRAAEEALIRDVVYAQEAARSGRLTPQIVIAFWIAYARLAHLVQPVTAASLAACKQICLTGMKIRAAFLVATIILFSIFLFMSNATLNETSELIDQQNAAALKLWADMQMLRTDEPASTAGGTVGAVNRAGAIIAEHVFEEMVEFSRKSTWLLQSASRLNYWFTPWWMVLNNKEVIFDADNKEMNHLNVPPDLHTVAAIASEAVAQIKAYQRIRDYALGLYKIDTLIYSSLATYFLPTVYALLGAFLYGFRYYSGLIRRKEYLPSAAHSARYFIAAIAGLVVGLFGSLLPKSLSLPPLAVAFLVGYAVEAFFSRLDELIRKLKGDEDAASMPRKATAGAGAD
jgi:hypothetical protein